MAKGQKTEVPIVSEAQLGLKVPHLLKYMGSKREIIDFIQDAINSLIALTFGFPRLLGLQFEN
jgi:hypothetical protein